MPKGESARAARRAAPLRPRDAVREIVARGLCSALAGLVIGCTLAARPVLAPRGPIVAAALGALVGVGVMLSLFPWRALFRVHRTTRDLDAVAGAIDRAARGDRSRTLADLLPDRDDALGPLVRAAREALVRSQNHRRDRVMIERTMKHSIRRATESATKRLRQQAETDPLTGLGNRRALEAAMNACFGNPASPDEDVAALVIDMDHFKTVNDELGHEAGDECLIYLGEMLTSAVRGADSVTRLGGDEFVVLLPRTNATAARGLAERLRVMFHQMPWTHAAVTRPTLSIGVGTARTGDPEGPLTMLRRADEALYEAKRAGRDAVAA